MKKALALLAVVLAVAAAGVANVSFDQAFDPASQIVAAAAQVGELFDLGIHAAKN
jgi:hypothetical protein